MAFDPINKSGVVYRDAGRLHVFQAGQITVVQAWPPMAWAKSAARPSWHACRPAIRLRSGPLERVTAEAASRVAELAEALDGAEGGDDQSYRRVRTMRERLVWLRWMTAIPVEAREIAAPFGERQFHVLSTLARCGEPAYDLMRTNPALGFALASCWVFRPRRVRWTMRSVRAQLRKGHRQRDVAEWLGFPGTDLARRILAKVCPQAVSVSGLLYLRDAVQDHACLRLLAAMPRINAGVLRIATDPVRRAMVSTRLLEEVAMRSDELRRPRAARALALLAANQHAHGALEEEPTRVRDLNHLVALTDANARGMRWTPGLCDVEFPEPPVPGTGEIVPLQTAAELHVEGRVQRHCVSTYVGRVALRKSHYVYRVESPERCTVSLVRSGTSWKIESLLAKNNRPVSAATWQAVSDWLRGLPECDD